MSKELKLVATQIAVKGANEKFVMSVLEKFAPELAMLKEAQSLLGKKITSEDQLAEMEFLRAEAKKLVPIRTGAEAKRKELKADALLTGSVLDAIGNYIKEGFQAVEAHLKHEASFADRAIADRNRKLGEERAKGLAMYGEPLLTFEALGEMPDSLFDSYTAQIQRDAEIKALGAKALKVQQEAEAEKSRLEAEAVKEEQDRVNAENARLKAENARLQAERDAERKAIEAENSRIKAEQDALAKSGDGERLLALIPVLREAYKAVPKGLTTPEGKALAESIRTSLEALANGIKNKYA